MHLLLRSRRVPVTILAGFAVSLTAMATHADPALAAASSASINEKTATLNLDAANDSEILARLLRLRCDRLLGKAQRSVAESG